MAHASTPFNVGLLIWIEPRQKPEIIMSEREIDDVTGVETTGHEWDGIKELNMPLPRWWLLTF